MIKKTFRLLNYIAIGVLLLSCLSCYVSPNIFWQISFLGLGFHYVLFINLLFLSGWLIARERFVWIPMLFLLLCWGFIRISMSYHFPKQKEQGIKLMTYNVKNFDLYNWTKNQNARHHIFDLIKQENPDILCLQEFYTDNGTWGMNLKYIQDTLGFPYAHFQPSTVRIKEREFKNGNTGYHYFGVVTFSKFPIVKQGAVAIPNSKPNDCIYSDIVLNKQDTVRLYNVHLQSIYLNDEDYNSLDAVRESQEVDWFSMKKIFRKMKRGYCKRGLQADLIAKNMASYSGTKIVCGDFNDVPVSYTHRTISKGLDDAFAEKGFGFGKTFITKLGFFRIDNVLVQPTITVNSYRILHQTYSDHYPVCITFSL